MHAEERALQRLEWSIRALAQDAGTQMRLFPSFVCVPDELVLEFDEYSRLVPSSHLPAAGRRALALLAETIDRHSGSKNEEVWTTAGLQNSRAWAEIRQAAASVLATMGWTHEPPPHDRGDKFVGPDA